MSGKKPSPGSVGVRMYRHGLGDCFLLTFYVQEGKPKRFLIDCGILLNSPGEKKRITRVLRHLKKEFGRIDVLIVTHEHWDHISGFYHAKDDPDCQPEFGEVWMAWTEKPGDPQAEAIAAKREQAFRAASSAVQRMQGVSAADSAAIESVLQFFGSSAPAAGLGLGFSKNTDGTMDALSKHENIRFHEPGTSFEHPGIPGVRFYVLGPPRSKELTRSNPRKGEAYEAAAMDPERSLHLALRRGIDPSPLPNDDEAWELSRPFDRGHEVTPEQARANVWFQEHYYNEEDPGGTDQRWRQIEESWLASSTELALQIDSATNNSSLVLAIELDGKKVLLFPGDAQAGSWRSWGSLAFEVPRKEKPVTVPELLQRIALYKVGHHGSHNATLRAQGLELMGDDFIAMIPVDRNVAMAPGRKWDFPFSPLEQRLLQKTRGRVIRSDTDISKDPPSEALPGEWKRFVDSLEIAEESFTTEGISQGKPLFTEVIIEP